MGGVAGHAGLFSTADDLARFAEMMLQHGELDGVRLFSPLTVEKFTTPETPPDQPILRGLGWDIDSPFSSNRGELFPLGSYGHTGFTGTSMWIDPVTDSYVILLTNSVHPFRRPPITALRGKVATIAAAALGVAAPGVSLTGYNETLSGAGIHREVARTAQVRTGLDVLAAQNFAPFRGKRIGLITNHTGLDRNGNRNIDLMQTAGVNLVALFSPEHGFAGVEDRPDLADSVDPATGIKIFSLYGKTLRPTPEMLRGVDALVFDIQDIGARFYTYTTTMAYAMEAAAKAKIPYYVLDRPNPITGVHVEGPVLDRDKLSVRRLLSAAAAPRHDHGRDGADVQRRKSSGRRSARDRHAGLAARRLVRFHRLPLDQSLAQYAQPECGAALSGHRHDRVFEELFGGQRHGGARSSRSARSSSRDRNWRPTSTGA